MTTTTIATPSYAAAFSGQNTRSQAAAPGEPAGQPAAGATQESFSYSDKDTPAIYNPGEFKNTRESTKLTARQWVEVGLCAAAGAAFCGLFGFGGGLLLGAVANIISVGTAGIEAIPIGMTFGVPAALLGGFTCGGAVMEDIQREAGKGNGETPGNNGAA